MLFNRPTEQEIIAALTYISADDRGTWVRMAFAIRDELGDAGFDIFDEWSRTGSGYNPKSAKAVWRSSRKQGVTISSLFSLAIQSGYSADSGRHEMSDEEYAERVARREADAARRAAQEKALQDSAATKAVERYSRASECLEHPYMTRKGFGARVGVKLGDWYKLDQVTQKNYKIAGCAIIPIINAAGEIRSLQAYFPERDERSGRDRDYLYGGEKSGCFFPLLPVDADYSIVVICEGWATGEAIQCATGYQVLLAFDAGNLAQVARVAREKWPFAKIIIAGDDDKYGNYNAGQIHAREAATACNGDFVFPDFSDAKDAGKPTDFDDMARLVGADAVKRVFLRVILGDMATNEGGGGSIGDVIDAEEVDNGADAAGYSLTHDRSLDSHGFDNSTVNWFAQFPDVTAKGKPRQTIENVEVALRELRIGVRYNVIKKNVEVVVPNQRSSVDNFDAASMTRLESSIEKFDAGLSINNARLGRYILEIADRRQFNPAAEWIRSKPWDGVHRFEKMLDTVRAVGEVDGNRIQEMRVTLMTRWFVSAVAAVFEPYGVSSQGVLVFQGPQNLGKTFWFNSLVPRELGLTQEGVILKPDDKDIVKQAISNWLVELGELDATFNKSDVAALKSWITKDFDVMRLPYAPRESRFPRRTICFASVNPKSFLRDDTGNRRYWVVSCESINPQHGLDMQQVWAEIYETMYTKGVSWRLTREENAALSEQNEEFSAVDPIEELIRSKLEWTDPQAVWTWRTATEVLLEVGRLHPTRTCVMTANRVICEMNGGLQRRSKYARMILAPKLKRFQ